MPEWFYRYLSGGISEIENMEAYQGRFVFLSRNEGGNFNALIYWSEGFSPELDFPRLAVSRIENRFFDETPLPDLEYGAFFIEFIRNASDAVWTGAKREDDFWILRKADPLGGAEFEFFILTTIGKDDFASKFDSLWGKVNPVPNPSRDQAAALSRFRETFFDEF